MARLENDPVVETAQRYVDVSVALDIELANLDLAANEFEATLNVRGKETFGVLHADMLKGFTKAAAQMIHTAGVYVVLGPMAYYNRGQFRTAINDKTAGVEDAEAIISQRL